MASTIQVDKIQDTGGNTILSSNSTGTFTYEAASGANFTNLSGVGKVLQCVSTNKLDTFTSTSTSFIDITSFSVDITPSATTSKVLVIANVAHSDGGDRSYLQLVRDSTAIAIGDAAGSRPRISGGAVHSMTTYSIYNTAINYLDSPSSTSAVTYKIQARSLGSTLYINRSEADRDNADYDPRAACTITAIEIGA